MKIHLTTPGSVPEAYRTIYENAAKEARRSFTDMIESISKKNPGKQDWFLSSPASRNTFASPLYTHCCNIAFIKKLIDNEVEIEAVITDSPALAKLLRSWLRSNNKHVDVILNDSVRKQFKRIIDSLCRLVGYPILHVWQLFQARLSRNKQKTSIPESPLTLIDTFVFSDNVENDRNYPGLIDYLTTAEKEHVYFVPTFYRVSYRKVKDVFKRLRTCKRRILFKEDYLKLIDYLFAYSHVFRIIRMRFDSAIFMGFDVSGLIKEEIRSFRRLGDTMNAFLNYRFAFRLKNAGVSLRLVIDWFENQVIDKGWNAGFNSAYRETQTIGYMGFLNTEFYLCERPTFSEKRSGLLPKKICVMGKRLIGQIKEFCHDLDIEAAPAFRFSHLHSEQSHPSAEKMSEFSILVALPFSNEETERIMSIAEDVGRNLPENVLFELKTHPTASSPHNLNIGSAGSRMRIVNGNFSTLLQNTDLLISAASSVCMETIAKGIPVIVVGNPNGLTMNPIPDSVASDLWRIVFNAEEMLDAIQFFRTRVSETIQRHQNEGKIIRDDFFTPVTKEKVRDFLRL